MGGRQATSSLQQFSVDEGFAMNTNQGELFDSVQPFVQSAVDGFPLCIMCYGQTGSGKTFTMLGPQLEAPQASETMQMEHASDRGVVLRSSEMLFSEFSKLEAEGWTFSASLSVVEIHNERFHDLLSGGPGASAPPAPFVTARGSSGSGSVRKGSSGRSSSIPAPPSSSSSPELRLGADGKAFVAGLTEQPVGSPEAVLDLVCLALARRSTKATKSNAESSRSHCVLRLRFNGTRPCPGAAAVSGDVERREGLIHFCDLAGSERLAKSGSGDDPDLLREAQAINKSLSALGNTVSALLEGRAHVPFRDSKLTHMLQSSLMGPGKCLMICNVSGNDNDVGGRFPSSLMVGLLNAAAAFLCTCCLTPKLCSLHSLVVVWLTTQRLSVLCDSAKRPPR